MYNNSLLNVQNDNGDIDEELFCLTNCLDVLNTISEAISTTNNIINYSTIEEKILTIIYVYIFCVYKPIEILP